MTLAQLESLTEDELAMALFIVNHISPLDIPKMELQPRNLTWFKHDALTKKLMDAFPRVRPEGHETFVSMMQKLGITVTIHKVPVPQPPPPNEVTASNNVSGSST